MEVILSLKTEHTGVEEEKSRSETTACCWKKGKKVEILMNDIPTFTPEEIDAVDLPDGAVLDGTDMPTPSDYLSAKQKNGIPLGADEIYKSNYYYF